MTKLKTKLNHRFNNIVTVANVDIHFDNKGEFEITEDFKKKNPEFLDKVKKEDYGIEVIIPLTKKELEVLEKQQKLEKIQKEEAEQKLKEKIQKGLLEYTALTGEILSPDISIEELDKVLLKAKEAQIKQKQKISQELAQKTMEELKSILIESAIPEAEWKDLKKIELIKFIINNS